MAKTSRWLPWIGWALAPLALAGCTDPVSPPDEDTGSGTTASTPADSTSTPTPPPNPTGDATGTSSAGTTSGGSSSGGDPDDDDGPSPVKLDVMGMPDASDGHCPVISVESEPMAVPSDIIIAVDTSGSMGQETAAVQANLNMFSQQIVNAGVDARVVLISSGPQGGGGILNICIDPPLGGGGCPAADDNEPLFLHVDQYVGSTNAFQQILDTYPQYQQVLRPDAVKQLMVVTDDNSFMTPQMFDAQFLALDITHFGYTQHGIVSMVNCPAAAQVGQAYMDLAMMTGGTIGDLCLQDFQPVFDQLATAVVDNAVPCTYDLPETSGLYDATTAEVEIDLGDGPVSIPSVPSPDMCPANSDAWFFDDPLNPTKIIFCSYTCLQLKQAEVANVEIGVTCATG